MALIDKETIRAEIERLRDEYTDIAIDSHYGTVNANHVVDDLEQLLSFLDSLPEQEDILIINKKEWEAQEKFRKNKKFGQPLPEQPVEGLDTTEDFVEEVRRYYSNNCTWDALKQPMLSIITRCARHFAEWGAEHAKK